MNKNHKHHWEENPEILKEIEIRGFIACSCGLVISRNCIVRMQIENEDE